MLALLTAKPWKLFTLGRTLDDAAELSSEITVWDPSTSWPILAESRRPRGEIEW
jgi:hypothetical protein